MPNRKKGNINPIIRIAAASFPIPPRVSRYVGTPTSTPPPKHRSWRLVKLNATLVFTFVRSLGTGTKGMVSPSFPCGSTSRAVAYHCTVFIVS